MKSFCSQRVSFVAFESEGPLFSQTGTSCSDAIIEVFFSILTVLVLNGLMMLKSEKVLVPGIQVIEYG